MRLMFIADIHGDLEATTQVLAHAKVLQPDYLLLLGDLLNHGPRNPLPSNYQPAKVAEQLNTHAERIIAVRGNCDSEVDQMLLRFPCLAPYNSLLYGTRRLFITHGHLYQPDEIPLRSGDLFISGHTHKASLDLDKHRIGSFNPGSVTFPRDGTQASFGWLADGRLSVRALEDRQELLTGCLE